MKFVISLLTQGILFLNILFSEFLRNIKIQMLIKCILINLDQTIFLISNFVFKHKQKKIKNKNIPCVTINTIFSVITI